MKRRFPFFHQHDAMDCGPACLRMIAKYYGRHYTLEGLRQRCHISREGVSLLGISSAAEEIGFKTIGVHLPFSQLKDEVPLPCIVHWRQNHFVVVYKIKRGTVYVADPASGLLKYSEKEFLDGWISRHDNGDEGIALLLEPQPDFYAEEGEKPDKAKFSFILKYLKPYRKLIAQLFMGMIMGTLLQLIFPFFTQSIVDYGIGNSNLSFVTLILVAQLTLYVAQTAVEFIRSWILLHISTRINISIISDFLIKLMKLPIGFFDTKMIGDLMQRIGDHQRIESFLTSSTLNTLFSFVTFIVFAVILALYSIKLLVVFLIGSALYVLWVLIFLKYRRELDYKRFSQASAEQSNLIQMITGMQEIKLNNCEKQKRWEWENIQAKLFKVSISGLKLSQWQQSGAVFINETKNILISYISARAVIQGDMSLGMMMAVQTIVGQLNSPISQMIGFIQSAQDAKISLERLGEIHNKKDETEEGDGRTSIFTDDRSIGIESLTFHYDPLSDAVLNDVNLTIPEGKVTAIVGMSGSGKTTLVKLLLGFYPPTGGSIRVGGINMKNIDPKAWRDRCGTLFVREGDTVNTGVPLALIENPAKYEDVIFLKENMSAVAHDSAWHCDKPLQLGEVQNSYLSYVQAVNALTFFVENDYLGEMIESKRKQIDVLSRTLWNYKRQTRLGAEQLSVAKEKFTVDSTLFKKGVISKVNFSESRNVFLQQRMAYQSMLIETDNMRMSLLQAEQSVTELEQSRKEQHNDLSLQLEIARGQLEASIRQWEQNYLLVSPARGTIALTMFWQRNQNITAGETMLAVVPVERSSYFGKIYLSQQGAGKAKTGQNVNIKLDDYPYMEFGFVQVGLSKMSLMPYEDASAGNIYVMEVELPDSLITQYGKVIPYRPEMSGTAEIITEDMSVLVRLINPIRAVLKR